MERLVEHGVTKNDIALPLSYDTVSRGAIDTCRDSHSPKEGSIMGAGSFVPGLQTEVNALPSNDPYRNHTIGDHLTLTIHRTGNDLVTGFSVSQRMDSNDPTATVFCRTFVAAFIAGEASFQVGPAGLAFAHHGDGEPPIHILFPSGKTENCVRGTDIASMHSYQARRGRVVLHELSFSNGFVVNHVD